MFHNAKSCHGLQTAPQLDRLFQPAPLLRPAASGTGWLTEHQPRSRSGHNGDAGIGRPTFPRSWIEDVEVRVSSRCGDRPVDDIEFPQHMIRICRDRAHRCARVGHPAWNPGPSSRQDSAGRVRCLWRAAALPPGRSRSPGRCRSASPPCPAGPSRIRREVMSIR